MEILRKLTRQGLVAVCLIGVFAVGTAQAATSNPPAPTVVSSTGTVDVTVTVPDLFWVQNLDAIALTYTPGSDATGNEPFCIFSTTAAYDITISSLTSTGIAAFDATGQAVPANVVNFGVQFDSTDADASDGAVVIEGALIDGVASTNTGLPPDCSADNVAIYVTFAETGNLDSAAADTYEDELTLLIEPD